MNSRVSTKRSSKSNGVNVRGILYFSNPEKILVDGYGGSPMPYCMFFSKYYAIHGSYHVPNHNASHGCVRIKPNDARWLYNNFMRIGTKVIIKSY